MRSSEVKRELKIGNAYKKMKGETLRAKVKLMHNNISNLILKAEELKNFR